jgi:predicted nucleic acid-binding Zn ribbon protein
MALELVDLSTLCANPYCNKVLPEYQLRVRHKRLNRRFCRPCNMRSQNYTKLRCIKCGDIFDIKGQYDRVCHKCALLRNRGYRGLNKKYYCLTCGIELDVIKHKARRKYCCDAHRVFRNKKPAFCLWCHKNITYMPFHTKYCCKLHAHRHFYHKFQKAPKRNCLYCGKLLDFDSRKYLYCSGRCKADLYNLKRRVKHAQKK